MSFGLHCFALVQSKQTTTTNSSKTSKWKAETKFHFYFLVDYRHSDLSVKVKVPPTWHSRIWCRIMENNQRKKFCEAGIKQNWRPPTKRLDTTPYDATAFVHSNTIRFGFIWTLQEGNSSWEDSFSLWGEEGKHSV